MTAPNAPTEKSENKAHTNLKSEVHFAGFISHTVKAQKAYPQDTAHNAVITNTNTLASRFFITS